MTPARKFRSWRLFPVFRGRPIHYELDRPTVPVLLEMLRTEAEIQRIGLARFSGTLSVRKQRWLEYRSFLRQATSNFRSAGAVEGRSSSLLHYYAMMNFAKAELLSSGSLGLGERVQHGLTFSPNRARTVAGDTLTVRDGVFRKLYQVRTDRELPLGTRLPVVRLLGRIPEIGTQLSATRVGLTDVHGMLQLVANDDARVWVVLAVENGWEHGPGTSTARLFHRYFEQVESIPDWKDRFAVSRRWGGFDFYQSKTIFQYDAGDDDRREHAYMEAANHLLQIKDVLGLTTQGMWDGWLSPSLYKSRMLPMPPDMARYAISFYASSIVRYRPAMFDSEDFPDHAYLFDAIVRECAVPMLVDTLAGLTRTDRVFIADDAMRN